MSLPPPPRAIYLSSDRPPPAPAIEEDPGLRCDVCEQFIEGDPAGEGVYLWSRGDDLYRERAPLCLDCATAIGVTALRAFEEEEEDG